MGLATLLLTTPFTLCLFLNTVVFGIFVNMVIVLPYYAFFKRLRVYCRVKKQRNGGKESLQCFCHLERREKKSGCQNSILETEQRSLIFKKWLACSWKDTLIISSISLIIIVFKAGLYSAFWWELNRPVNSKGLEVFSLLFSLLFLISACVLLMVPVILVLRALLTSELKKKILQLEELTRQQEKIL